MNIGIAGVSIFIQQMDHADIKCLCNKYLLIDYQEFKKSTVGNDLLLEYSLAGKAGTLQGKANPSLIIRASTDIYTKDSNVLLNIKRPFFARDAAIATGSDIRFDIGRMIRYISRYRYSIKQLDIAYADDEKCLSVHDIQHWCKNSQDYCVGNLVKWGAPELVMSNGVVRQVRLESTASKTNYGTINIGPKTGRISLMLHVRKKEKIQYILADYGNYIQQQRDFEARSRKFLVSCIDFITARSKKVRVKAKYQQQTSWESFLGGKIEAINWSRHSTSNIHTR